MPSSSKNLHVNEKDNLEYCALPEQEKAYTFALSHDASLLFGDTGSGKTEVYMKLFEACINKGQKALFLLPEIGLTPQMKRRLKHHFGNHVAIWHSKIHPLKKKAQILHVADRKTLHSSRYTFNAFYRLTI